MASPMIVRVNEFDLDKIDPPTKNMFVEKQGGSKIVVIGKPGCFAKGTSVLMYDGTTKNVEDVEAGDVVMGDDSTPRNVMELCRNREEMFRVIPEHGDSYDVNLGHKLVLVSGSSDEVIEITVRDYLERKEKWG